MQKHAEVDKIKYGEVTTYFRGKQWKPSATKKKYAKIMLWRVNDWKGLKEALQTKELLIFQDKLQNKLIKREEVEF